MTYWTATLNHLSEANVFFGIALASCVVLSLRQRLFGSSSNRHTRFWSSFPTVGVSSSWFFPWTRASLNAIIASAANAAKGYNEFCKEKGLPFALPSTGVGAIIALPTSLLHVLNKSESDVIAFEAQLESLQPQYMIGDRELYENIIHFDVVRKHMTRSVGQFVESSAEELAVGFSDCWDAGSDEWLTVNAWDTCSRVIARAANRAFIGLPLCRDETLLRHTMQYANAVYGGACMITALPRCLRPVFGPLIALPAKHHLAACQKILVPVVKERIALCSNHADKKDIPDDALQWMIERCSKFGRGQLAPEKIAQRLLILNLVSIYTLAYAFTNVIVDLYGDESKDSFITGLRDECDRVSAEHSGLSSVGAIKSLYRVDSTIRESMRISAFGIMSLPRIVGAPGGLDLGSGIIVPPGVRLGVPSQAIHRDAAFYHDPLQFDAFRFSSKFETPHKRAHQAKAQKLSVDVDKTFLTYGYGKHACPGRWFASQVMKQALAYVVQNYDVKLVGSLPQRKALLNMVLPPTATNIAIRRRS